MRQASYRAVLAAALTVALLALGTSTSMAEDVAPDVTAQPAQVDAGATFDLEVSVLAHANGTYRVAFDPQTRFSFPGPVFQEIMMVPEDSHIFRVSCTVDDDAPGDDYLLIYNLTWTVNGTARQVPGTLRVTVGGGPGGDEVCTSSVIAACAATTAIVTVVWRRRDSSGTR